ncbi:MAG: hypothetical protein QOJ99_4359, partial [Bryobacterales bacterium]|nr:hypothetical protein [Bryobacterales bacterium]
ILWKQLDRPASVPDDAGIVIEIYTGRCGGLPRAGQQPGRRKSIDKTQRQPSLLVRVFRSNEDGKCASFSCRFGVI